jgi:molecular chaperone GrpE (heat shock protein)
MTSDEAAAGARHQEQNEDAPRPAGAAAATGSTPLLEADDLQAVISRWREIQAEFVDQPRRAMQDADTLVRDVMERLTRKLAEEHDQLESRWSEDERASTEDLRQGLQLYRSFFERLLAA